MLRQNIVASYFSQAYVTLIGIVILPLYIKFMGAEAYGLIGFFTLFLPSCLYFNRVELVTLDIWEIFKPNGSGVIS